MKNTYNAYEQLYDLISASMILSGLHSELKSELNLQSQMILGLFIPHLVTLLFVILYGVIETSATYFSI